MKIKLSKARPWSFSCSHKILQSFYITVFRNLHSGAPGFVVEQVRFVDEEEGNLFHERRVFPPPPRHAVPFFLCEKKAILVKNYLYQGQRMRSKLKTGDKVYSLTDGLTFIV